MRYCISDIHGEYDLFCRLMEYVKFSDSDELFVLGDMTDKGLDSVSCAICCAKFRISIAFSAITNVIF